MMAVTKSVDLSGWLSIDEVADKLGVSIRTIERQRDAGNWQTRLRPRPGAKPQEVFDPQQVEDRVPAPPTSLVRELPPPASAMGQSDVPTIPTAMAGLSESVTWAALVAFLDVWIARQQPPVPEPQVPWIRLQEASEITGLSKRCLRKIIRNGGLAAIDDMFIKVRRDQLESIDLTSALMPVEKKAKAKK